jgi:hypothetical protein
MTSEAPVPFFRKPFCQTRHEMDSHETYCALSRFGHCKTCSGPSDDTHSARGDKAFYCSETCCPHCQERRARREERRAVA